MSNIIQEKVYNFSLRIVRLTEYLNNDKREFVLSRKILDSGVNISLFVEEAQQAENKPLSIEKYPVANRESFKVNILLRLLRDSDKITHQKAESLLDDCTEIHKLLISSLKTARANA